VSTAPAPLAVGTAGKVRFVPDLNGQLIDPQSAGGAVTRLRMWAPGLSRNDPPTVDVGPAVRADLTEYDFTVPGQAIAGLYLDRVDFTASASGPAVSINGTTAVLAFGGSTGAADHQPFATAVDVSGRLGVPAYTGGRLAQVNLFLADASEHLRLLIGQDISPARLSFTAKLDHGDEWVDLPQLPARAIVSVTIAGVPSIGWELIDQQLYLPTACWREVSANTFYGLGSGFLPVDIVYDSGFLTTPPELVAVTAGLVTGMLSRVDAHGSLVGSDVTAETLGSYSVSYGASADLLEGLLSDRQAERLRSRYGQGAYVTHSRRSTTSQR
jgi:hypothetical protein